MHAVWDLWAGSVCSLSIFLHSPIDGGNVENPLGWVAKNIVHNCTLLSLDFCACPGKLKVPRIALEVFHKVGRKFSTISRQRKPETSAHLNE